MSDTFASDGNGPVHDGVPNLEAESFWGDDEALAHFAVEVSPAEKPLAILEKLGSSPFERGQFPFIGFLATTFEKVSQFALEQTAYHPPDETANN